MFGDEHCDWINQHQSQRPSSGVHWTGGGQEQIPMGMHDADLSMCQYDTQSYRPYIHGHTFSPNPSYGCDMETSTPPPLSPPNLPIESFDGFLNTPPQLHSNLGQSNLMHCDRGSVYGTDSLYSGVSPLPIPSYQIEHQQFNGRPLFIRSATEPDKRSIASVRSLVTSTAKRSGSSDEDDESLPDREPRAATRKRQRIPHTAVERRYRENLNAHLEKLRKTVPSLARRGDADCGKDGSSDNVRPSKCEILSGAIEHIGAMNRENTELKSEVRNLRKRLNDADNWYGH